MVYWRAKFYICALICVTIFSACSAPLIGKKAMIILVAESIADELSIFIIMILTRYRICFADTFLCISAFVRHIGLFYLSKKVPTAVCRKDIITVILQYGPLYVLIGEILIFKTNMLNVIIVIQIFLIGSVFNNWQ